MRPAAAPPRRPETHLQEGYVDAVSQDNFEAEVVKAPGKVLVDFWAEWCGPCRMIGPVLEEMSGDYADVKFVKLNVDEAPAVAQQFSVMNIPTILAFEGGELKQRIVGAMPKAKLVEELGAFLG
jgi:thioredoxin 1